MEIALQLAKNIGGLFIILFVGFIFVKGKILKPEDTKTVSKIVLYMAMPSSIITSFQVEYTSEKLADFGVALLGGLLCQLIFMGIGWLMKRFGKFSDRYDHDGAGVGDFHSGLLCAAEYFLLDASAHGAFGAEGDL